MCAANRPCSRSVFLGRAAQAASYAAVSTPGCPAAFHTTASRLSTWLSVGTSCCSSAQAWRPAGPGCGRAWDGRGRHAGNTAPAPTLRASSPWSLRCCASALSARSTWLPLCFCRPAAAAFAAACRPRAPPRWTACTGGGGAAQPQQARLVLSGLERAVHGTYPPLKSLHCLLPDQPDSRTQAVDMQHAVAHCLQPTTSLCALHMQCFPTALREVQGHRAQSSMHSSPVWPLLPVHLGNIVSYI